MQKLEAVLVRSKQQAGNNKDFHVSRYRRLRTRPEEKKMEQRTTSKDNKGHKEKTKDKDSRLQGTVSQFSTKSIYNYSSKHSTVYRTMCQLINHIHIY